MSSGRLVRRIVLLAVAGLGAAGLIALAAASRRPGWYRPVSVDFRTLPADKAAFAAIENEISAALNAGRSATLELDETQVNRWLAARDDLLAGVVALPSGIARPCVRFGPEGVEAAATIDIAGWPAVISVVGVPRIEGESLVLDGARASIGRLRLPLGWVADRSEFDPVRAGAPGLRWPRSFVWTNGQRPCQLVSVELSQGAVHATLAPTATASRGAASTPSGSVP